MGEPGQPGGAYIFGVGDEAEQIKRQHQNETGEYRAGLMNEEITEKKAKFDSMVVGKTIITVKEGNTNQQYVVTEKNEENMTVKVMTPGVGSSSYGGEFNMEDIIDNYEPKG